MSFRSPWQRPLYVRTVAAARRLLRPWPRLENGFIAAETRRQNRRVRAHLTAHPPRSLLLIMPRCVKKPGCPADVRHSLEQCLTCRDCALGDVARLCRKYEIEALVAFRSHIAFDMARTRRPDVIIATACHDRLVKALRSVPEIPALLAPLTGMRKMCVDAGIDLAWLEDQLRAVTAGRSPGSAPPAIPSPETPAARAGNR